MYIDYFGYPAVAVAVSFLFFFDFAKTAGWFLEKLSVLFFVSGIAKSFVSGGGIQTCLFEVFSSMYFLL